MILSSAKPDVWQIVNGEWSYANGVLRQTETGAARRAMHLNSSPADFDASVSFTIRGGEKWKSVGIAFDIEGKNDVLVYMSAASGGFKIQVALQEEGKASYPGAGAVVRPVSQDVRYTLSLRVRGQLINANINDEPVLSYRLPQPRRHGAMGITAFDADVEFHNFQLAELSFDAPMREPVGGSIAASGDAKTAFAIAEKQLAAAKAKPAMLRAVFAADKAKQDKALAKAAAAAESKFKLAQAEADLVKAENDTEGQRCRQENQSRARCA